MYHRAAILCERCAAGIGQRCSAVQKMAGGVVRQTSILQNNISSCNIFHDIAMCGRGVMAVPGSLGHLQRACGSGYLSLTLTDFLRYCLYR